MFLHFIPHKGKGAFVLLLPLLVGIVLFIIADAFHLSEKYLGPISLLASSLIIWFYDDGPALLREGFNKVKKSRHTLFWIEIKYWALVMGIAGCIWLGTVMENKA